MAKRPDSPTDWKSNLKFAGWALLLLVFVISVGFTDSRMQSMPCTGIDAVICDSTGHSFIDVADVLQLIEEKTGALKGRELSSINMAMLENTIRSNPFVASVRVFSSIEGRLHAEVRQRDPILRVINYRDEGFYIDRNGSYMPLSGKYTARVPVANGYIYNREAERNIRYYSDAELKDTSVAISRAFQVYEVAEYMRRNDFWNSQIEQIYMNVNGDMELIPRVGDHTIVFGDARELPAKFDKLYLFYKEGLNKTGWNKYKTINLKYKDQVVCTKR
jgi:cell division protein FtsQ